MTQDFKVAKIEIIPIRLPLTVPFVVAYASYSDVQSVLVKITSPSGAEGWGEATPDPHVTGESWHGVAENLRHSLAPVIVGTDARNIALAHAMMNDLLAFNPSAKAAIDIALHDLAGRVYGTPVWALLGGACRDHLTISRVVSMLSPQEMADDALRHVSDGFDTIKLKVGDTASPQLDVERIHAVREAVGPGIGIKVDVNQGWSHPGTAIAVIRESASARPAYFEQPVSSWNIEGLAEVRKQTGAIIMADETCLGPVDMQRIVSLRAADLVNIKLMKSGGIAPALKVNTIAETSGITSQIGTMVESSIASAAGLHTALSLSNVLTVEMGGPLMIAEDVGDVRGWYSKNTITVPDKPGLGIIVDEDRVAALQVARWEISAR
ncbi:dipeptide epimerase [soil metagenome]